MELINKVALITGSSSGIGKSIALKFASEGAKVVVNCKNNIADGEDVVKQIKSSGGDAILVQADLQKESDADRLINESIKAFGTIDILVNNAGGYDDADEWDATQDVWEKSLQQNLISTMNISKYCSKVFLAEQKGVIINIASRYALSGRFDTFAYSAAKAGVINITQSYAKLLKGFGRSNSISPGAVMAGYWITAEQKYIDENNQNNPLGRFIEPDEIADLALYLASKKSEAITGQNILIDGGYSLSS